jgi:hypothetical protein
MLSNYEGDGSILGVDNREPSVLLWNCQGACTGYEVSMQLVFIA